MMRFEKFIIIHKSRRGIYAQKDGEIIIIGVIYYTKKQTTIPDMNIVY